MREVGDGTTSILSAVLIVNCTFNLSSVARSALLTTDSVTTPVFPLFAIVLRVASPNNRAVLNVIRKLPDFSVSATQSGDHVPTNPNACIAAAVLSANAGAVPVTNPISNPNVINLMYRPQTVVKCFGQTTTMKTAGIALDRDVAGHGWFIDLTPTIDTEFGANLATMGCLYSPTIIIKYHVSCAPPHPSKVVWAMLK